MNNLLKDFSGLEKEKQALILSDLWNRLFTLKGKEKQEAETLYYSCKKLYFSGGGNMKL